MKKDIKKMLKKLEKVEEKAKSTDVGKYIYRKLILPELLESWKILKLWNYKLFRFLLSDPDTRVQNLEEKVTSLDEKITDIESENETLKEEKIKTETEKEALLQQIQVCIV